MIELLSESRCLACNICVKICPTNVFDEVSGGIPAIARREDCQTCFMCEAYCPADALYVSVLAERREPVDEAALVACGLLGSYRRNIGWARRPALAVRPDRPERLLFQAR